MTVFREQRVTERADRFRPIDVVRYRGRSSNISGRRCAVAWGQNGAVERGNVGEQVAPLLRIFAPVRAFEVERHNLGAVAGEHRDHALARSQGTKLLGAANLVSAWGKQRENYLSPVNRLFDLYGPVRATGEALPV